MSNVSIDNVLDAVVSLLQADKTLTALLGVGPLGSKSVLMTGYTLTTKPITAGTLNIYDKEHPTNKVTDDGLGAIGGATINYTSGVVTGTITFPDVIAIGQEIDADYTPATGPAVTGENTDKVGVAGDGLDSIFQNTKKEYTVDQLQRKSVLSPLIAISWTGDNWQDDGSDIYNREFTFSLTLVIYNPRGSVARLETGKAIIERIYTTLIGSQLSLDIDKVRPQRTNFIEDVTDEKGQPLGISVYLLDFKTVLIWQ